LLRATLPPSLLLSTCAHQALPRSHQPYLQCESSYCLKASGGAIRRALGKLEHGVCVACGVDARGLVCALQSIRLGASDWEARRRDVVRQRFPK
jgi:hypothetical protein